MANWTVEQVGEWLKKCGFKMFVRPFKDRQIDGEGLLGLTDDVIMQILSVRDNDEKENKATMEQFKYRLHEWKIEHNINLNRRNERRNSAARTSSATATTIRPSDVDMTSYTKTLTITPDNPRVNVRFFKNPLFCSKLQLYLSEKFNIKCSISPDGEQVILNLIGMKQNVKSGRDAMKDLFETTQIKIYNSEDNDQKGYSVMYWSNHIYSDTAIDVIQQIMNNEKIFTLWDKTEMLQGYYRVIYFTHQSFAISPEEITQILHRQFDYLENVPMPIIKTKNFIKEIEQFIINTRQSELAIIRHRYPNQIDIKISLFGRKKWVKIVKKKLQIIVNKHTIKTLEIKLTEIQYQYLLDHCLQQIKDLQNQYIDDNVTIQIRLKEFNAPQYLIDKIKQQINEFICQTTICIIENIGKPILLTDEDNQQLNNIAKQYICHIEKIDSKNEMKVISIPKALTETSSISKLTIQQSNQFCSSLTVRRISVLNGSIQIHKNDQSISLTSDVTVICTDAGAIEENITPNNNEEVFDTKSGRKILFKRWSPPSIDKLKQSIAKLITSIAQTIQTYFSNAQTIAFSTTDWDKFHSRQQVSELFIIELKREMEARNASWTILFSFNEQQIDLYNQFKEAMIRLQADQDGFAQYSCLVSTMEITLMSSKGNDLLLRCDSEMKNYIHKYISTTETLKNASDLRQWDQHTINSFYKYCLDKSVMPKIDLTTCQLDLIGSIENVIKAMEKYKLISEIIKLKSSIRVPPPIIPRSSVTERNKLTTDNSNIAFSYCQDDESVCHRLTASLVGEGYSVRSSSSDIPLSQSQIDRSDLLLVYFSENYAKDVHCMANVNYAKSLGKTIIPIAAIKNPLLTEQSSWLCSMTLAGLFYDIFDKEIDLQFTDDFDLGYDQILTLLLRHTKPGVTGQHYPATETIVQAKSIDTDYEQPAFGHTSLTLQKLTDTQRKERETDYKLEMKKRMENEKISEDDINILVASLILVKDDLDAVSRGENPYNFLPEDDYDRNTSRWNNYEHSPVIIKQFSGCIKRWLERAPNVIKGNIPPFTPTGDINDARFPLSSPSTDFDWWKNDYQIFDNSPLTKGYFSILSSNPGSWFTNEQAHDYYQRLIHTDDRTQSIDTKIEENEVPWDTVSLGGVENENNQGDDDDIDDRWKTPEEIQKIKDLDNPNQIAKIKKRINKYFIKRKKLLTERFIKQYYRNSEDLIERMQKRAEDMINEERPSIEKFVEQKLKNIIEFEQLCQK